MSPPTGLASVTANVTQGFRTWARLVRALRRWSAEALGGTLLPHPFALFEKRWDSIHYSSRASVHRDKFALKARLEGIYA